MFKEANDISIEFMNDAIRCDMIGMNQSLMTDYVHYVSDRLLLTNKLTKLAKSLAFLKLGVPNR